jgi:dTDP-4-amino-4,6-dideoxygalactose transaminase
LAGWPCDMDGIMSLAEDASIKVIEDCAQAHGAKIGDRSVGSFGHVGAWSFCQDKIMTTGGEGGMVTTDDLDLWAAMWSYKDHGKDWDSVYAKTEQLGFRWVHNSFGTNWRMLEMQAVLGRIQLRRLSEWTQRRSKIANSIRQTLNSFRSAVRVPVPDKRTTHAFYRLYGYTRPEGLKSGWSRDRIVAECRASGVPVMQGSCSEIYLEKAFDETPWRPSKPLPVAHELGKTSLAFLCHPTMTDAEVARTCRNVSQILDRASR